MSPRRAEAAEAEAPTLNVTDWTDKTELFMEYPPLVAGQTALFAVHLTRLARLQAADRGPPSRRVHAGELAARRAWSPDRSRRGPARSASKATAPPPDATAGRSSSTRPDCPIGTISGSITVFADEQAANADAEKHPADDPSAIAYLKEQQWTNAFATAQVREAELRTSLRVPAAIEPLTGGEAIVAAPAAGRFTADSLIGDRRHAFARARRSAA